MEWKRDVAAGPPCTVRLFSPAVAGLLFVLLGSSGHACFYTSYWFDSRHDRQTSVRKLVYGEYAEVDRVRKTPFYADEVKRMEAEHASRQGSPEFLEDYAYALFRVGRAQDAERIWRRLLKAEPDRYSTLCSLATAAQLLGRYDEATTILKRAISLRPGFRQRAEEYHLKMLEYLLASRHEPGWVQSHLFLEELTPLWLTGRMPPGNLATLDFPDVNLNGLAEVLRQFPSFGDGWLALGMVLEHDKEYSKAKIAYQKALKAGTAQSPLLKKYLDEFIVFEKSRSPARLAAREVIKLLVLLLCLALLYWFRGPLARLSTAIARNRGKKQAPGKEVRR